MRVGYSVTVSKNGEPLVTIEREMISGRFDLSSDDEAAIREAGEHLTAMFCDTKNQCFVCGGVGDCEDDCPLTERGVETPSNT